MNDIDIELFDKWLNERRYIKKKSDRKRIISTYKRLIKNGKSINDFEEELDRLGWCDITINEISKYLLYYKYRNDENKKMSVC